MCRKEGKVTFILWEKENYIYTVQYLHSCVIQISGIISFIFFFENCSFYWTENITEFILLRIMNNWSMINRKQIMNYRRSVYLFTQINCVRKKVLKYIYTNIHTCITCIYTCIYQTGMLTIHIGYCYIHDCFVVCRRIMNFIFDLNIMGLPDTGN